MGSHDEELTLENVDEQVEQCLSESLTVTSLARTVHNLQSIYTEERRLEHVWRRINSRVPALHSQNAMTQAEEQSGQGEAPTPKFPITQADGQSGQGEADDPKFLMAQADGQSGQGEADGSTIQSVQGEETALQDSRRGRFNSVGRRSNKLLRLPFRQRSYNLALVAAVILIAFLIWPVVSYALRGSQTTSPQPVAKTVTPQTQSTVNNVPQQTKTTVEPTIPPTATSRATPSPTAVASPTKSVLDVKVYSSSFFTIQYPGDWVITSVTTGGTYQQTVQFRPSVTSSVFVNVNVLYQSNLSSTLLLLADSDVQLGTLLSTSSVTYHGIPWAVGIVKLSGSAQTSESKLEVAYSNQTIPYKIAFGAPSDTFSSYEQIFNTMFASFYPVS